MKTQEFLQILESNTNTSLLFEYTSGQLVGANYHITEVKHVSVDSVDCGGQTDAWNETIIQLWESPSELGKTEYMTSHKALEILNTVGKIKTYDLNSEVKIEYSNSLFHTAQLFVSDFELSNGKLLFKLDIEKTDCKAKEICGVNEPVELASEGSSCAPGSGCC
jgi:hypothetical protein|tara:strand:- start:4381 stop:4872 length:492 start_codon:yes stop_codon:yes gene_type:complete